MAHCRHFAFLLTLILLCSCNQLDMPEGMYRLEDHFDYGSILFSPVSADNIYTMPAEGGEVEVTAFYPANSYLYAKGLNDYYLIYNEDEATRQHFTIGKSKINATQTLYTFKSGPNTGRDSLWFRLDVYDTTDVEQFGITYVWSVLHIVQPPMK